jgi:hypothetical protein
MLLNMPTYEEIPSQRASVTSQTPFVDTKINKKEVKILARGLPRQASDADFKEVLMEMEGDEKAAAAAYCAEFGLTIDGEELEEMEKTEEEKFIELFTAESVAEKAKAAMEEFDLKIEDFKPTGQGDLIKTADVELAIETKKAAE